MTLQEMAAGDYSRRIPLSPAGDELDAIAHGVNILTEEVECLLAEKEQAHRELADALKGAQAANRAKGAFLAAVEHELRTPLNAVLGFSSILQDGLLGPLTDSQRSAVDDVHEAGAGLLQIIEDVLLLSRLSSGEVDADTIPFRVEDVLSEVVGDMVGAADEAKANVTLRVEPGCDFLEANPRHVSRILTCLLSNAIKFSPEGGNITITAEPVGESMALVVADQGIGIPSEQREALFRMFHQLDGSLSRERGGIGMGLSIVRFLTELHGGEVSVRSVPGQGSRFRVCIGRRVSSSGEPSSRHGEPG